MTPQAIVILEGPAGSGKSWAGKILERHDLHVLERNHYQEIISLDGIRDYGVLPADDAGALFSQKKDMANLIEALSYPADIIPVIDRCYLSQLVYGSLRRKSRLVISGTLTPEEHLAWMSEILIRDLNSRTTGGDYAGFRMKVPQFIFLIMMPSIFQLNYQRQTAGKHYPFDPEAERELYLRFERTRDSGPLLIKYDASKLQKEVEHLLLDKLSNRFYTLGVPHVFSPVS